MADLVLQLITYKVLAIYAPMIFTAPCVMFLMRADMYITRASGRGLGPGNRELKGPAKWHRADRRVPFGAKITHIMDLHANRCINSYDRPVPHWSAILISRNYSITRLISYPEITPLLSAGSGNNYLCTCDLCSPMHNVLDGCIYITWGSGRGLGPGIPEFFWAL